MMLLSLTTILKIKPKKKKKSPIREVAKVTPSKQQSWNSTADLWDAKARYIPSHLEAWKEVWTSSPETPREIR